MTAPDFTDFWDCAFYNRVGKQAARREWDKAVKRKAKEDGITQAEAAAYICDAMHEFANSDAARPETHSPIHPRTWLSQGRYDDDRATWNKQQPARTGDVF